MAKKDSALSRQGLRAAKKGKPTPDDEIDFSDIPELTDAQLKSARRLGRPRLGDKAKRMISIRLDPDLLLIIQKEAARKGKRYQAFISEILAKSLKKKAA
jgi:uncharacterized protein (DUF4415 family)